MNNPNDRRMTHAEWKQFQLELGRELNVYYELSELFGVDSASELSDEEAAQFDTLFEHCLKRPVR